jgi:preprotein translocase subunit YajC
MFNVGFVQAAQAPGGIGFLGQMFPLILIFVVFYFLLIRPQQKKTKEHRQMLAALKKNDEVLTAGGVYGKVVALADAVVTLEVAQNVKIRVSRPQISAVIKLDKAITKEAKAQ